MRLLSKLSIIILFISISACNQNNSQDSKMNLKNPEMKSSNDYDKLIDGIWAESEDENAFFYIKNDSLYNIEHQDRPYKYDIIGDTLRVLDDLQINWIIIKLTKDSLLITNEYLYDTVKLYKR